MKALAVQGLKEATLGQCIWKTLKPNSVILPLLFGLGVENDHTIGSKTLLREIAKLGFAISYDEVKQCKQSVLMDEDHKLDCIKNGTTHL